MAAADSFDHPTVPILSLPAEVSLPYTGAVALVEWIGPDGVATAIPSDTVIITVGNVSVVVQCRYQAGGALHFINRGLEVLSAVESVCSRAHR